MRAGAAEVENGRPRCPDKIADSRHNWRSSPRAATRPERDVYVAVFITGRQEFCIGILETAAFQHERLQWHHRLMLLMPELGWTERVRPCVNVDFGHHGDVNHIERVLLLNRGFDRCWPMLGRLLSQSGGMFIFTVNIMFAAPG